MKHFNGIPDDLPETGANETAGRVQMYFERLLNKKDLTVCDEMLAVDYIDHDAPASTPPGPGSVKAYVAGFLADYPDMHIEIKDIFAVENRAAARLVWCGTHRQTGEVFHQMGIVMLRFNEHGQMVERWSAYRTPGED